MEIVRVSLVYSCVLDGLHKWTESCIKMGNRVRACGVEEDEEEKEEE